LNSRMSTRRYGTVSLTVVDEISVGHEVLWMVVATWAVNLQNSTRSAFWSTFPRFVWNFTYPERFSTFSRSHKIPESRTFFFFWNPCFISCRA
jgi:hypothetical protein